MVTTDGAAPDRIEPVLAPGAVVAERYRIEARLGAGGGGTVFRCVDQQLGQTVALKIVSTDGDLERWRREVAMARQITDRNVCRVHDLGETADLRYVTMELIEGESLRSKTRPDLPAAEARALIEQLISGVAAIHRAGVVHRDLKPENVVVTPDGRAVIVDFGIAKTPRRAATTRSMKVPTPHSDVTEPSATITRAGFAVGTPRYMSPEQANAEPVDARTDVWALGLVAHELLIGAMPILDVDGPVVASVVDDRWPRFASVLRRCLTLDAKERFADAIALQAALPSTASRSRWPWIVTGVGALAAISIVVVKLAMRDSASPPEVPTVDPVAKTLQLTTTLAKQWPAQTPISVAIDASGTQFAYTTGGGGVYVRPVAGGAPVEWKSPAVTRFDRPQPLIAPRVIGWFSDGALAITGATPSAFHLVRLRADGSSESLHQDITRFHAAIAKDEIAIADRSIHDLGGRVLAELTASRIVALARSDGKLAWLRVTGGELILEIATGNQPLELWRGRSQLLIDPLLAFSGSRIVFSFRTDQRTTIASIDTTTKQLAVIEETPAHIGTGSVAGGVALMIRGTAREVVQIRDRYGTRTGLAHLPSERGDHLAGWTTTGGLVLRVDDRIVIGSAADDARKSWRIKPWPGTAKEDLPVATQGDDLIVRRANGDAWLVDRITAAGARTWVGRFPHATALHCLPGNCVVQHHDGDDAVWSELAPSGALGKPIHRRRVGGPSDFALSPDGAFLVIAAQGELIAIDRATGLAVAGPPSTALATRWSSVGFDAEGDLWATAETLEVQPFGIVRFRHRNGVFQKPSSLATEKADILRHFTTPAIHRDGEGRPSSQADTSQVRIAVATQELALEIWRTELVDRPAR